MAGKPPIRLEAFQRCVVVVVLVVWCGVGDVGLQEDSLKWQRNLPVSFIQRHPCSMECPIMQTGGTDTLYWDKTDNGGQPQVSSLGAMSTGPMMSVRSSADK